MPFAKLNSSHIRDGLTYAANTVLNLDADTLSNLVTADIAETASNQGDWSAMAYALGDFVRKPLDGTYWWANAATSGSDVPGVSSKWTSVVYQSPSQSVGGSAGTVASEGDNFKIDPITGSFYLKTATGALKKPIATDESEGEKSAVAIL